MHQETSEKLNTLQFHDLFPIVISIIFPMKVNKLFINFYDPSVTDGNAKSIARKIFHDCFRVLQIRLDVNCPFFAHHFIKYVVGLIDSGDTEQLTLLIGISEQANHLAAKDFFQCIDRIQIITFCGLNSLISFFKCQTRNKTMDMDMVL